MLAKLRPRSAYDVMAVMALFVALATGSAYAANTVFSSDIVDGEVKEADIGTAAVREDEIGQAAVAGAELKNDAVTSPKVLNGTLVGADVLDNTLKGADIDESTLSNVGGGGPAGGDLTGSYPNPQIGPNAVGFSELQTAAFAAGDIASTGSAFGIAGNGVQSSEISDETVTGNDVDDGSLDGGEIANNSLTGLDIDEPGIGLGSAYVERTADLSLTTTYAKVLDSELVLEAPSQLLAVASLELDGDGGNDGDDHAFCYIEIDAANGPLYGHTIPDTLYDRSTISIVFARASFAGQHSVDLWCKRNVDPSVAVTDAGMVVAAIPLAG